MIVEHSNTKHIREVLKDLPRVTSVHSVTIKDRIIEHISIETESAVVMTFQQLQVEDAETLFDFYFNGLTEKSREFFPPYPLFSPSLNSVEELETRIRDWQEEDDWAVLKLVKDEQIIGVGLLKRYQTERPVSGLAVQEEFQKAGLGVVLQTIINEQARLLGLEKLYATLAQENIASLRVHEKCGFKQTGKLVPHLGYKDGNNVEDRLDIEMVREFY